VVGNPVMNERGLVGRVVGVERRQPGAAADRHRLAHAGDDRPHQRPRHPDRRRRAQSQAGISARRRSDQEGDRVVTSGDGGVVPRGLPVGAAVKGLDGRWRVVLFADRRRHRLCPHPAVQGLRPAGRPEALNPQPAAGDHRGSGPRSWAGDRRPASATDHAAARPHPPNGPHGCRRPRARRQAADRPAQASKARGAQARAARRPRPRPPPAQPEAR
jgi:rod shape-determining protein MreC